jgi:hypothetical protein
MNGYEVRSQNVNEVVVNLARALPINSLKNYRKPPTKSPGLIYFRKRFLMGLYKGGLIHGRSFVLVINKSDINKSVINRKINMY